VKLVTCYYTAGLSKMDSGDLSAFGAPKVARQNAVNAVATTDFREYLEWLVIPKKPDLAIYVGVDVGGRPHVFEHNENALVVFSVPFKIVGTHPEIDALLGNHEDYSIESVQIGVVPDYTRHIKIHYKRVL